MFRASLVSARQLLVPRALTLKSSPEACASSWTSVSDKRGSNHSREFQRQILLPDQALLLTRQLMNGASQQKLEDQVSFLQRSHHFQNQLVCRRASTSFQPPNVSEIMCNYVNMARCIDLNNLKDAPPPIFWTSMAISAVQLGFPFLELVGGYSPVLTYLQLYIASLSLVWNAGQTWGMALSNNPKLKPDWDTMSMALMPVGFALTGLILPYPLGFLTVATGLLTSLYCDLKACAYPPWSLAAKFLVTLTSTIGLLLALMAYVLFHNRENSKENEKEKEREKKKNKELPPPEVEDSGKENDDSAKKTS